MGDGEFGSTHGGNPNPKLKLKLKLALLISAILAVASVLSVGIVLGTRTRGSTRSESRTAQRHAPDPSLAISRTCNRTRYPTLCVDSLVNFPGALAAGEHDLVHISVNATLQRFGRALSLVSSEIDAAEKTVPWVRAAYEDCVELLEDSVEELSRSLAAVGRKPGGLPDDDVVTWLSGAMTNQETCREGLKQGKVKKEGLEGRMRDLSKLVSNCLAIYKAAAAAAGGGVGRRRLMMMNMPEWVGRELVEAPTSAFKADIVVSKEGGNGRLKTIREAINSVPDHRNRRTIIYVMAGRYEEDNLKVGRRKTNVMLMGDGKGKTVISGGKSVFDNMTTFHTASFAATGAGFIARDITFENWAGPTKHQAVALRLGADHAVIYRCNIIGYQDTLYVHSQRQFFRECDIYGTVDFIFGNAAVVFQNCSIYARKPMAHQNNVITAQNRRDPNQNTGISIQSCRILATPDLELSNSSIQTYLGRPWGLYSRTVYMQSYMGDHIDPRGWLEWNGSYALDTLYYGEYMNYGPGGAVGKRVDWPGYRVIATDVEANKFTVAQFIYGPSWLPPTRVAFLAGLEV